MYETVSFEKADGVGWLTLNRPEKLNAFTATMNREVTDLLKQVEKDDSLRALVITGSGRAFCAGEDLSGLKTDTHHGDLLRKRYNPMIQRLYTLEKPTIAMVGGAAAGAGMSLALACDFRIASEQASFLEAFVHIGLVPDSGSLYFLPRIVGYAKALELAVLGEKVGAEEAKAIGLVTQVVPSEKLREETAAFAGRLADMPTKAIGLMKRYMRQSFETRVDKMLENEAYAQRTAGLTEDHREGVAAFLEKRKPVYKGY
ncbi:enoyl-CoA hydratase-related protein [Camelliibacillus cellulosilyticus]|uniref:Enoyl-CoA hydratase-related protein n=1 Tax=Camelliibacillus cellulosilyticus TaxID=2174486 RepID=A0ABV9GMH6_9BACL